ncbi:MAG: Acetylglutamate kinase [Phycisphaerae bacterium]|nr:Acetylglutamate kinase [Phycisphaerae bacterium]
MHGNANLEALRTAIPYIRAYKGRTFVVKLSGRLCRPGAALQHVVEQVVLLHQLGIRVVVVHGGGDQADELAQRLGVPQTRVAGRRITDDQTLEIAKMAFGGSVNADLLAQFRRFDTPAVGLSGIDARIVTATRRPPGDVTDPSTNQTLRVDFGHVGDIVAVQAEPLEHLLAGGYIPAICSLAADPGGAILNINADSLAARIATALGAAKYFLMTNVDGVFGDVRDPATLQSYMDIDQLDALIRSGAIAGGMLPKLAACIEALRGGVPKVHIVNGTARDALLAEVFTNEGCGTLLVARRDAARTAETPLLAAAAH